MGCGASQTTDVEDCPPPDNCPACHAPVWGDSIMIKVAKPIFRSGIMDMPSLVPPTLMPSSFSGLSAQPTNTPNQQQLTTNPDHSMSQQPSPRPHTATSPHKPPLTRDLPLQGDGKSGCTYAQVQEFESKNWQAKGHEAWQSFQKARPYSVPGYQSAVARPQSGRCCARRSD